MKRECGFSNRKILSCTDPTPVNWLFIVKKMGKGSYIRKDDKKYIKSITYCVYCQSSENLTIDHIVAKSTDGNSNIENLTRACGDCNSLKLTYSINEFLERIINKRIVLHNKLLWYIKRLKDKDDNRYGVVDGIDLNEWLRNKVAVLKKRYTYYTAIINSIVTKKYLQSHN